MINETTHGLDIRIYPVKEAKGDTLAFASVAIDGAVAINGVRVVKGRNGPFVSMPQTKDREGNHRDVAHPLTAVLRKAMSDGVIAAYDGKMAETEG